MYEIWYGVTSLGFGLLLYIPVNKVIFGMAIGRLQRKEGREAFDEEKAKIRARVSLIAIILSVTFAFIYNKYLMVKFFGVAR